MRGEIVLRSTMGGYTEKPAIFSVGGHTFIINKKEVPFDWNVSSTNVEITTDGHLVFVSELRDFDYDSFKEEYQKLGIQPTAELLAGTQEITEVFYECYAGENEESPIVLEVLEFSIDEFEIPKQVISKYNQMIENQK